MFFEFLKLNYKENEPIFISEIQYKNLNMNAIRQQILNLTNKNLLIRYDTGIYFIPGNSIFKSSNTLNQNKIIEKKYISNNDEVIGYFSGLNFANRIGLTTQVPNLYEVVSNKATCDYREIKIGTTKVILRKPRTVITIENHLELQFLDMIKEIDNLSFLDKDENKKIVLNYMNKAKISFEKLQKLLEFYPDKIYKNLYQVGVLNGVSA
ncbi:MAG: hypothetical protein IJ361_11145 [Spirochaetaceae bacterium]|nr:hypothetical protein [Spirochaetaceae bacterium]